MLILTFVIFHLVISPSQGQVVTGGGCPSITPKPNFDFRQYMGIWYEVEKYLFIPQITGNCVYVRYKDFREENSTFIADIVQFEILSRKPVVSSCDGRISSADGSAAIDLKVPLPLPVPLTVRIDYPYYIIDTDYVNYSIKWACREVLPGRNTQTMWILARSRNYEGFYPQKTEKLRSQSRHPCSKYHSKLPSDFALIEPPCRQVETLILNRSKKYFHVIISLLFSTLDNRDSEELA